MSSYGPPGQGRPEDPFNSPSSGAGGYPPPGGSYPPPGDGAYPPPGGSYPPPGAASYPPPGGSYPPGQPGPTEQWGPAPTSGPGMPGPFPPAPPAKKGNKALIIVLVVILVVCGCLGGGGWLVYNWTKNKVEDVKDALPTSFPTAPATPDSSDSGAPTASPTAGSTSDDTDFKEGDCVVNEGTDSDAELKKVPCGPKTYEILSRIPFTTDEDRCSSDPIFGDKNSDATYKHDDLNRDYLDYVLCLKKR